MAKRKRYTQNQGSVALQLRKEEALTWRDIGKRLGVSDKTARVWAHRRSEEFKSQAKKLITPKNGRRQRAKEESEYLRWWYLGERRGWVERLLKDLKR